MSNDETPFYLILHNSIRKLEAADAYLEVVEGDENLKESLISHFNYYLEKYYEEADEDDYKELMEDTVVFQIVDKSDFIMETLTNYLTEKTKWNINSI